MITVKDCSPKPYDRKEILRYAGVRTGALEASSELSQVLELLESCLAELEGRLACRVCFREFPIRDLGDCLDLGFAQVSSRALQKNLKDCDGILLFGATIGLELDRLIAKYGRIAPAKAFLFQAIGAERIESLCDTFCQEIKMQKELLGQFVVPRFSPGYGDLPLELQREIFRALECPKHIGLTLNASLLSLIHI